MRLAAIYNVWDGDELLEGSIDCILDYVDYIIIVYQNTSNFGEYHRPHIKADLNDVFDKHRFIEYKPIIGQGHKNEIAKRNVGLDKARELGCTHFLHLDCDEYYQDFGQAKQLYIESGHAGSVVKLHTYFKKPTLRLDVPENYFVPFIHELKPDTTAGVRDYRFHVDPTRRINESDVVELPIYMHHYSWVRKDIGRKARNSTARANIAKNTYLQDYERDLKAGDYIACYDRKLIEVEDYFNINAVL